MMAITVAMIDREMGRVYSKEPEFKWIREYLEELRRIEANQKALMERIKRKRAR